MFKDDEVQDCLLLLETQEWGKNSFVPNQHFVTENDTRNC